MRQRMVEPGAWEPYYAHQPVYSVNDVILYEEQVYRRFRHIDNRRLGYEYATILDIVGMVEEQ
jgi:hypothetical protein